MKKNEKIAKKIVKRVSLVMALHSGVFHADDVLCAVVCKKYFNFNVRIVRTRNPREWASAHIVADVGRRRGYWGGRLWADHHHDKVFYATNGIQKSAIGFILPLFFNKAQESRLLRRGLFAVQAQDNGQDIGGTTTNPFGFIHAYNNTWMSGGADAPAQETRFEEAASDAALVFEEILASRGERLGHEKARRLAEEIGEGLPQHRLAVLADALAPFRLTHRRDALALGQRIAQKMHEAEDAIACGQETVRKACEASEDGIVVLPAYIDGWQTSVCQFNEQAGQPASVRVAVWSGATQACSQVVPVADGSFDSHVKLPEEWLASRPQGAKFVHQGRFFAAWDSVQDALTALREASL